MAFGPGSSRSMQTLAATVDVRITRSNRRHKRSRSPLSDVHMSPKLIYAACIDVDAFEFKQRGEIGFPGH